MKWQLDDGQVVTWPLPPAPADAAALRLIVYAPYPSQRFVEVTAYDVDSGREGHAVFTVDWTGPQELFITRSLLGLDATAPWPAFTELKLTAGEATMPEDALEVEPPVWVSAIPPVLVNAHERLLVNFMHEGYWKPVEWARTSECTVPADEGGLSSRWLYGILSYVEHPDRMHRVAVRRPFSQDLTETQALVLAAAVDQRGRIAVHAEIDGAPVVLLKPHGGCNAGEELRLPVSGQRLDALTLILDENPEFAGQSPGQHICAQLRWLMLERNGAPVDAGAEVTGTPPIAPALAAEKSPSLPLRLLFAPSELESLRTRVADGIGSRLFAAIHRKAEETLDDNPERFVGTYLPIDWGGQGVERAISPTDQAQHWFGNMVHGGLVFALTGERAFGEAARRALLCAVRCTHWAAGFPSRIPAGFGPYRAPFVEAHTSEAVALAYDWIYDLLSEDERDEVEDALFWKGAIWIDAYLRSHGEGYLLHSNQGAVYFCGLVFACLGARCRHPQAETLLDRHLPWFRRMLAAYYNADGTTNEGLNYWQYTTHYATLALHLLERHRQVAPRAFAPPHFANTLDYLMHMRSLTSPELRFLNVGDCLNSIGFDYMSPALLYLGQSFGAEAGRWLWQRFLSHPRPVDADFYGTVTCQYISTAACELLWADDTPAVVPALPAIHRFTSTTSDRIFARTGVEMGDWLLYVEAGPQTFAHTHFDKGSFILEACGDALVCDAGMIVYSDPACDYLANTAYHNLVTLSGRNQSYRDAARAAQVLSCTTDAGLTRIQLDLTDSYQEFTHYLRTLVFRPGAYLLVIDEVESQESGLEWRLHSQGTFGTVDGTAQPAQAMRLVVTANNAAMELHLHADSLLRCVTQELTTSQGRLCGQLIATPPPDARRLRLASLLVPYLVDETAPPASLTVDWENVTEPWMVSGPWGCDRITDLSLAHQ